MKKYLLLAILFPMLLTGCGSTPTTTPEGEQPVDKYYTVTYLANGGTGNTVTEQAKENSEYTLKSYMFTAPETKEFNKWVIDNKTYNHGDKITVTKDVDVLATYKDAQMSGNTFTVTFDANGGAGHMNPVTIEEGFSYVLPQCEFTAPLGYDFDCWGIDGVGYKPGRSVNIIEDTIIYAYWKKNGKTIYTVSFASNGGSGTMNSVQVEEGMYTLPSCEFTAPSNKTFDYWTTDKNSTHYQPNQQILVEGNTVVTANWKNIVPNTYTISFNANGGSGTMSSQTANENEWFRLPECKFTAPTGKEFDSWTVEGRQYLPTEVFQVTKSVTCYAKWVDESEEEDEPEWEDDKTLLDCGSYSMGFPSNKNSPIILTTTLSADDSSWFNTEFKGDVDNGYRYIYKNSCSDGPSGHKCSVQTYSENHDGGGLKITDPGTGFGSPMFSHQGAKLEIRIGVSSVNKSSQTKNIHEGEDFYHVYFFNKNNEYLGKYSFVDGSLTEKTTFLKMYYTASNAKDVAFFEFRCNSVAYKGQQAYNIGVGYCNVKSWERA